MVYALDKFHYYLIGSDIVIFTDHSALKYLLTKQNSKARLIRWVLLLQEFNIQIKDKKGVENAVTDHLSRLTIAHNTHNPPIFDEFPEESLLTVSVAQWYAHIANFFGNWRFTNGVDNTRQEVLPCKGSFVLLGRAVFVQVLRLSNNKEMCVGRGTGRNSQPLP